MTAKQFSMRQLMAHASGEFPCHKASKLEDDGEGSEHYVQKGEETPHCAGVLIFLEKRRKSHQMMRIAERIGLYDHTKLDMKAKVR